MCPPLTKNFGFEWVMKTGSNLIGKITIPVKDGFPRSMDSYIGNSILEFPYHYHVCAKK